MQIVLSFLLPLEAGLFHALPTSVPDKIGKRKQTPAPPSPPPPPLKAYELVENEQTNEQNTTVNSSQKEPTDTQNSKNTVLFFFLFFEILITIIPLNGQYHRHGLSPGVLVGDSGVVLPSAAQWNWEATLRSAGQFSSDILSLNFTVW